MSCKWMVVALMVLCGTQAAQARDDAAHVPTRVVAALAEWLDAHSEYPRPPGPPQILMVSQARAETLQGVADRTGRRIRGLYDAQTATIYLTLPWSPLDPEDLAVLLHELVHHRQAQQHWYCPQAQEWRAYQLQAEWLRAQGRADAFYWPAIVLQSSCARRDIHPE